jgi:hypothetical protein
MGSPATGCPGNAGAAARLQGTALPARLGQALHADRNNLFLAASIAATPEFDNAADVPPDFTGTQVSVPHPVNGVLYLKLRDDPETVQTLTLPVMLPFQCRLQRLAQRRLSPRLPPAQPAKSEP